jgi:DNA invertase Pin-like site-specific DNA recombinase
MIVDGYIRVSQVNDRQGERFISPAVQREAIERWVRLHGAVVAELFEELDESGARGDRPLLARAIARVERGESGGIVVSRLDRFGRSLLDGLAAIDRITRAGGTFVAVEDGLDLSTDTGRLVLRIMLSLGEWELDRVRSSWRVAKQRAIARGVHVGRAPAGYRRRSDGRLVPDRRYAPLVTNHCQKDEAPPSGLLAPAHARDPTLDPSPGRRGSSQTNRPPADPRISPDERGPTALLL